MLVAMNDALCMQLEHTSAELYNARHAAGAAHLAQKEMATSVRMITSDVAISAPSNRTLSKGLQAQKRRGSMREGKGARRR